MKFKSFEELSLKGLNREVKKRQPKELDIKCKSCGGQMEKIAGSNVIVCRGTAKDGKPCKNYILLNR